METQELLKTHDLHAKHQQRWRFLLAAYEGAGGLENVGAIERHERESLRNYRRRLKEAYDLNYSKAIVDLFTHYLFRKPPRRELGGLGEDVLWRMFRNDCDLWGVNFDIFLIEQQRIASIMGHTGVLVDKYPVPVGTRAEELSKGVYPFVTAYSPLAILDWEYERDESGRPVLSYLKLQDDDGLFRVWRPDAWQTWKNGAHGVELAAEGPNPLGEIPFVWLYNLRSLEHRSIGHSDISDIADIDLSIVRNLSQCEEVLGLAGFPMMRKPMREHGQTAPDLAGVSAILEFNPEHGDAGKPDWLKAEVGESVRAIMDWISFKVREIYRAANAGGQGMSEITGQVQSGVALKTKFQLLNSKLAAKGANLAEAERSIIRYWLKWQGQEDLFPEVLIERPRTYEVDDLDADLTNALKINELVPAPEFKTELMKRMAAPFIDHLDDKRQGAVLRGIEAAQTQDNSVEEGV